MKHTDKTSLPLEFANKRVYSDMIRLRDFTTPSMSFEKYQERRSEPTWSNVVFWKNAKDSSVLFKRSKDVINAITKKFETIEQEFLKIKHLNQNTKITTQPNNPKHNELTYEINTTNIGTQLPTVQNLHATPTKLRKN